MPVPDYRKTLVTYKGNFIGYNWQQTKDIPSSIIAKYAGEKWVNYEIRQELSSIDWQVKRECEQFEIAAARDLIIPLQGYGKIREEMNLEKIAGIIDASAFIRIQQAVRAKALDLVSKIKKEIPSVVNIDSGGENSRVSATESKVANNITQQTNYGDVTNINATGDRSVLQVEVGGSFVHALTEKGIDKKDAEELKKIVQKNPKTLDEKGIASWVGERLKQGNEWVRGMPKEVATATIIEMIKKFF